jgi:hypothetical protein
LIFSIIAFAVISGCAKDPKAIIASYDHEKFLREKAQYEPEIGKDLWVRIPVFCARNRRATQRANVLSLQ